MGHYQIFNRYNVLYNPVDFDRFLDKAYKNQDELIKLVPNPKALDVDWDFFAEIIRREDIDPLYQLALEFLEYLGIFTTKYPNWRIVSQDGHLLCERKCEWLFFAREKDARQYAKHFLKNTPQPWFLLNVTASYYKDEVIL